MNSAIKKNSHCILVDVLFLYFRTNLKYDIKMSYLGFMIFWGISLRIFLGTGTLLKICFSDLFFLSVEPSIFFHFFLTLSPSPFWLILFFQKICLIYLISIITLVFIFLQDCPRPPTTTFLFPRTSPIPKKEKSVDFFLCQHSKRDFSCSCFLSIHNLFKFFSVNFFSFH